MELTDCPKFVFFEDGDGKKYFSFAVVGEKIVFIDSNRNRLYFSK